MFLVIIIDKSLLNCYGVALRVGVVWRSHRVHVDNLLEPAKCLLAWFILFRLSAFGDCWISTFYWISHKFHRTPERVFRLWFDFCGFSGTLQVWRLWTTVGGWHQWEVWRHLRSAPPLQCPELPFWTSGRALWPQRPTGVAPTPILVSLTSKLLS